MISTCIHEQKYSVNSFRTRLLFLFDDITIYLIENQSFVARLQNLRKKKNKKHRRFGGVRKNYSDQIKATDLFSKYAKQKPESNLLAGESLLFRKGGRKMHVYRRKTRE